MPRTIIPPIPLLGSFDPVTLTWTQADVANGNACALSGKELILVRNQGASSRTLTLRSVEDPFNRLGDMIITVPAGGFRMVGPMIRTGWQQDDGSLYLDPSSTELYLGVVTIP